MFQTYRSLRGRGPALAPPSVSIELVSRIASNATITPVRHRVEQDGDDRPKCGSPPAIAPPSTRVPVNTALFRLIAFVMCCSPTSST